LGGAGVLFAGGIVVSAFVMLLKAPDDAGSTNPRIRRD